MSAAAPARTWGAHLKLGFRVEGKKTLLAERAAEGPLVVQKPLYPEGEEVCHAIVVHPPGGIAGGDDLRLDVKAGAHSVSLLGRRGHADGRRQHEPPDMTERVGDDLTLDVELPRVVDVRVEASAAKRIGGHRPPIRRRIDHIDRIGVDNALADALDARGHLLSGDRSANQHDLSVEAGDHPATRSGFLNGDERVVLFCTGMGLKYPAPI